MLAWPGVFVSSTCYDMIDIRAEIEVSIRDMGLIPVMSDRPTSEFDVNGYRDSITTCLENIKKCPTFVCVLSNRYGPRLGPAGFDDVSATHLEYRAAVAEKRRIIFYARDRLLGDLQVWRNARRSKLDVPALPWVDADQYGIFELLTEHMRLSPGDDPNWIWPFRDSVELKHRLALDLSAVSRKARLAKVIDRDRLPVFALASTGASVSGLRTDVAVQLHNMGLVTALQVEVGFEGQPLEHVADGIAPANAVGRRVSFDTPSGGPVNLTLVVRYATQYGDRVEERHSFESLDAGSYVISRSSRAIRLLDTPAFVIE